MDNETKAKEIANNDDLYGDYENKSDVEQCCIAAMEMAKWKDSCLKQFLTERISIDYNGRFGEDGSPIASDYLDWVMESQKAAEDFFEAYKNFEKDYKQN